MYGKDIGGGVFNRYRGPKSSHFIYIGYNYVVLCFEKTVLSQNLIYQIVLRGYSILADGNVDG